MSALNGSCAQLTRDLFAIAKFLLTQQLDSDNLVNTWQYMRKLNM